MPIIRSPRRLRSVLAAAGATLAAVAALPTLASAACAPTPTTQAFQAFGDTAPYSLLAGGDFESGAPGWTLGRGTLVSGNEPWKVHAATDRWSLKIPSGAVVVSPSFCVGVDQPTWRFFSRRISGGWGAIDYFARIKNSAGRTVDIALGSVDGGPTTSWTPTEILPLGNSLPLAGPDDTLQVRLVFVAAAGGAAFQIDDVHFDPYVR